jgi:chromosome segregation ATPase
MGAEEVTDEAIEDLRERMRLLQGDRKANIDLLETSKTANKETIRKMRAENKELRTELATVKGGKWALGGDDDMEEVQEVKAQVHRLRKQNDDLRHRGAAQAKILEDLKDNVKDLELEARRPNLEDSPLTRKIRMLENQLDKAMIKFNEAQSIKKTYEQIVKRLQDERVGFDNQLAALERTLSAKRNDYEELLLLSADANHAREVAVQELERVRGGYEEVKRHRDKEVRERRQIAQVKSDMQERIAQRERLRDEIAAENGGGLSEVERAAAEEAEAQEREDALRKAEAQREKIDIFESAFRQIKEATGVSDVNEVIQKIVSQESTTENLMVLTKENQTKVEQLAEEKAAIKARVEEIKYSGPGGGHKRKMVDDNEEALAASSAKLERARLKYERLAKMLIQVKAGIDHLAEKLDAVRQGGRQITMTDDTIVDVLYQCEQTAVALLGKVKAGQEKLQVEREIEAASKAAEAAADSGDEDAGAADANAFAGTATGVAELDEDDLISSRPFNQRITLPSGAGELAMDGGGEGADDEADDEELTREKLKKASGQIMNSKLRGGKKGKGKKGKGGGGFDLETFTESPKRGQKGLLS